MPEPFLANLTHSPLDVRWFSSSHASHASGDRNGTMGNTCLSAFESAAMRRYRRQRAGDLAEVQHLSGTRALHLADVAEPERPDRASLDQGALESLARDSVEEAKEVGTPFEAPLLEAPVELRPHRVGPVQSRVLLMPAREQLLDRGGGSFLAAGRPKGELLAEEPVRGRLVQPVP